MKLLNSFVSPFAARVRLAIYTYDLPVEIVPSGQWLPDFQKSPAYLAINPIGLVPTLLLDDDSALPESSIIVEYLADAFPRNGLVPQDPQQASRARLLAHLAELYVYARGASLTPQIFSGKWNQRAIDASVSGMDEGLGYLEHFFGDDPLAVGEKITVADCAMAPFFYFFADRMVATFKMPPIIQNHPKVAAYWERLQDETPVKKLLKEMRDAISMSPLKAMVEDPT